jgi:hypothetical protein
VGQKNKKRAESLVLSESDNQKVLKTGVARIVERLAERQLKTIPIDSIRCETLKVPVREWWGGKSIELFPPYKYFKLYHEGDKSEAIKGMQDWYYKRIVYDNLLKVPKSEGGMAGGSLFDELDALHKTQGLILAADLSNVDDGIIRETIRQKVQYRFSIFESIKEQGLCFTWDFVRLIPDKDYFYLRGGHHRVAALAVCGITSVRATVSESIHLKILRRCATSFQS